jgi:antirestriction protein ArdC
MPDFTRFRSGVAYYATLSHELTHWSGAEHRLARDLSGRFGGEAYAMEELVAELGSAFLSARLELTPEVRMDHAGYVENWLRVLKNDKRAIFTAAAKAEQAVDWMARKHELLRGQAAESRALAQAPELDGGPDLGP